MAKFFALRVADGKIEFSAIPEALKEDVRKILIERGLGYLANEPVEE